MEIKTQPYIITPRTYHNTVSKLARDSVKKHLTVPITTTELELYGASLILTNPIDRIVVPSSYRFNLAYGIAKFIATLDPSFPKTALGDVFKYANSTNASDFHNTLMNVHISDFHALQSVEKQLSPAIPYQHTATLIFAVSEAPYKMYSTLMFLEADNILHATLTLPNADMAHEIPQNIFLYSMLHEMVARRGYFGLGNFIINSPLLTGNAVELRTLNAEASLEKRWPLLMNPMPLLTDNDLTMLRHLAFDVMDKKTEFEANLEARFYSSPEACEYVSNLALSLRTIYTIDSDARECYASYNAIKDVSLKHILRRELRANNIPLR